MIKRLFLVCGGLLLAGAPAPGEAQGVFGGDQVARAKAVEGRIVSYNPSRQVIQIRRADGMLDYISARRAQIFALEGSQMTAGVGADLLPESMIQATGVITPDGILLARQVRITAPPENLARVTRPTAIPPVRVAINQRGGLAAPVTGAPATTAPREMVAGERLETYFDPAERLAATTPVSFQGAILTGANDDLLFRGEETVGFTAEVVSVEADPSRMQLRLPSGNLVTLRNDGATLENILPGTRFVIRAAEENGLWTVQSVQAL